MKVLFAGLGSIGCRHLRNLHKVANEQGIALEVTALRSSSAPLLEEIGTLVHKETQSFLKSERFDLACITGPTHLHEEVIASLQGRVNTFFIEKPIFHRADVSLHKVGLDSGQKAYVAAPMRWTGVFMALEKRLASFSPYSVRALCSSYLPDWRKGVDYREVYSANRNMGGGVGLDLIHEWDYLVQLFGFPQKSVCMCGKYSHLEIDSDDLAVYLAQYQNFLCELHLDYFGREARRSLEIFTRQGTIRADFINGSLQFPNEAIQRFDEDPNERYLREIEYLLYYTKNDGQESINSPQHATRVLQLAQGV